MVTTKQTAFRFTDETLMLIDEVGREYGLNRTAALNLLIRRGHKVVMAEKQKEQTGDGRKNGDG